MKNRYIIYIVLLALALSCTQRSYIPEEVYYSVDFDNSEKSTTKPAQKKPAANAETNKKKADSNNTKISSNTNPTTNSIIEYSKTFIGTPYKYGGVTPSGFDCSGFVMYVHKNFNIDLPRNAKSLADICDKIDKKNIQSGDFVFFKGSNLNSSEIGHVALVTEKTGSGFKMIHATSSKGVIINDFDQYEYWTSRYLFAGRLKQNLLIAK